MPWHNPDVRHLTYDEAARLKISWQDLIIITTDEKMKNYIKENFKALFAKIESDVAKQLFDPTIPIGHTSDYFSALLGEEVDRQEDPYQTWQRCESKLIEEAAEKDD